MTAATTEGLERRRAARRMRASGMTWRAIGEALGVSPERARQLALLADDGGRADRHQARRG